MAEWKRLCRLDDLPERTPLALRIGRKEFLVVRTGGRVRVCGNKCPHHGARLSDGLASDTHVFCPWHHARFDLVAGRVDSAPALDDLPVYEVEVKGSEVLVGPARPPLFALAPRRPTEKRTFVIVGGGAAGEAAVEALARSGFGGRIVLVTDEEHLPYDRTELTKGFLAGDVEGGWLPLRGADFYQTLGVEVITGARAEGLDPARHLLLLAGGRSVRYDRLLVATGARARRLAAPGADAAGCHTLRGRDDAERIVAALPGARRVVIVGAGLVGLEAASSLRARGLEVDVAAPERLPLAGLLGRELGLRVRALHEAAGTRLHLGVTVSRIVGGREVILSDGTRLGADLVIIGVGAEPNVEWLEGSGLADGGAVPVDAALRTREADVFAAGDLALVSCPRLGAAFRFEHWASAQRQGRHAAAAMLGAEAPYTEAPFFWSLQCGKSIKYAGFAGAPWDTAVCRGDPAGDSFLAVYFAGRTLVGAASLERSGDLIAVEALLRDGKAVTPEQAADERTSLAVLAGLAE